MKKIIFISLMILLLASCRPKSTQINFGNLTFTDTFSFNIYPVQNCTTKNLTRIEETQIKEIKKMIYENGSKEDKIDFKITRKEIKYNQTSCVNLDDFIINTTQIDYVCENTKAWKCIVQNNSIICDSKFDGNGDGKCHKGESCVQITPSIKEIKIQNEIINELKTEMIQCKKQ